VPVHQGRHSRAVVPDDVGDQFQRHPHRSWSHGLRRVRPVVRRPLGAEAGQAVSD
jgi:hypothetical protein